MVSEKEKEFICYWEKVRIERSKMSNKITSGLPMAAMFGLPIILSLIVVRIFFPDWHAKMSSITFGMFMAVVIAVIIAVVFYGYFRMHFKWEMNEQLYKELKIKEKKQEMLQ